MAERNASTTEIGMRPKLHSTLAALLAVAAVLSAERADAQAVRAVGVDLTVGGGSATGGTYHRRGGPALDAVLGGRVRPVGGGAVVAALSGGLQGPFGGADICVPGPTGGCLPNLPFLSSVGALLGWESGDPRAASVRVLAGPAYYSTAEDRSVALQGRLDVATPAMRRVAVVLSARGAVLPDFGDAMLRVWSLGVGLRVR